MKYTLWRVLGVGTIAALALWTSGCASRAPKVAGAKPKPRYVYVPVTGSHIGRRVLVNEDGTLAESRDGSVQSLHPSVLGEVQRKGSVNPGRGN